MSENKKKPCTVCPLPRFADGLCRQHHMVFSFSHEYARVKTAVADWVRRGQLEKENGQS